MKIKFRCPPILEGQIPEPLPASRCIPEWWKKKSARVACPTLAKDIPSVKKCLPFADALRHGFCMRLAADVFVENGEFSWQWIAGASDFADYPKEPMSFHESVQIAGLPLSDCPHPVIKFHNFWTIRTDPGYSLLITHPFNRLDLPFQTLTGIVDTDNYSDAFIQFPALWSTPDFNGVLDKGTPIAQVVPIFREPLDSCCTTLIGEYATRFGSTTDAIISSAGLYRKKYRQKKVAVRRKSD